MSVYLSVGRQRRVFISGRFMALARALAVVRSLDSWTMLQVLQVFALNWAWTILSK